MCSFLIQICVRSMAKCDAVTPLIAAMKRRGDIIHITAEAIKKMYDLNIPELVVQVSGARLLPQSGNSFVLPSSTLLSLFLSPSLPLLLSSLLPFLLLPLLTFPLLSLLTSLLPPPTHIHTKQAINGDLVPFLLGLLEGQLDKCDKPSATKAIIAESLKAMAKDLGNGEKVCRRAYPSMHPHKHTCAHTHT